jgi:acyl-CoA thioester hydrolase
MTGERLTRGHTIQVAIDAATRELQFVSPPVVFEKLERAWAR